MLPVAKDYPVTAGENQMLWNGTYEGVFAPEGIYRLVAQFSDGSEADTAILVGQIAPFLTSISALESTEDGEVRLSFYASENGRLTLGLWGASWSLLKNIDISAGTNEVTVDATALSPDTVAISLTLTDDTGYCSNEEHVAVNPASFGILPTATPTAEPSPRRRRPRPPSRPHADAIPHADGSSDTIPHAVALAHTLAHADPEHHLHAVLRQPV